MLVSDTCPLRHFFVATAVLLTVCLGLPDAVRAQSVPTPANAPNPPPPVQPAGDPPSAAPSAPTDGTYDPPAEPAAEAPGDPQIAPTPETPAPTPATTADTLVPTDPTATPPTKDDLLPPPGSQTRWEPYDREAARTADGSLDVCSVIVFPLTFIPGVGDIVGSIGDWVCIIPAAIAVDYLGAFHGGRESHFWQPGLALVVKKIWETVLDTPIAVVTIGVLVASTGGAFLLNIFGGLDLPYTVISAGVVGATLVTYLALKAGRDAVGDLLFQTVYGLLTPEVEGEALVEVQRKSGLKPGVDGIPGTFGLIATVAGSKPRFRWQYVIPVAGPVIRSGDHAKGIQARVRRYGSEVLLVEKQDLSTMDFVSDTLATVQGVSFGVAHVTLGLGVGLIGGALIASSTDGSANEHQQTAEIVGGVGLVSVAVGGAAVVAGTVADRLQPVLVPAAFSLAE